MDPVEALARCGGTSRRRELLELTDRKQLDEAVADGLVLRDARGRYASPAADDGLRIANRLSGVLSHTNAALHWGWKVKLPPERPHVTFRRKRNLATADQATVIPHWSELKADDVVDGQVTSKMRTLVDCMRGLPFDEALAIADSALRAGDVTQDELRALAAGIRGSGAKRARRIAACADGRADNPFESVLRAIALDVEGLCVEPQVVVSGPGFWGRHDLVDVARRLVLEADSHEHHKSRADVRKDCRRYNALVINGWLVLRFAWEDVMFEPELVRKHITDALSWELRRTGTIA